MLLRLFSTEPRRFWIAPVSNEQTVERSGQLARGFALVMGLMPGCRADPTWRDHVIASCHDRRLVGINRIIFNGRFDGVSHEGLGADDSQWQQDRARRRWFYLHCPARHELRNGKFRAWAFSARWTPGRKPFTWMTEFWFAPVISEASTRVSNYYGEPGNRPQFRIAQWRRSNSNFSFSLIRAPCSRCRSCQDYNHNAGMRVSVWCATIAAHYAHGGIVSPGVEPTSAAERL